MTALREAVREACERRDLFDEAGDYDEARLLGAVADVFDFAGRIAEVADSADYRAALVVQREVILGLAGRHADDVAFDTVHDLTKLAIEVERLVAEAMRAWAAPRPVAAWTGRPAMSVIRRRAVSTLPDSVKRRRSPRGSLGCATCAG